MNKFDIEVGGIYTDGTLIRRVVAAGPEFQRRANQIDSDCVQYEAIPGPGRSFDNHPDGLLPAGKLRSVTRVSFASWARARIDELSAAVSLVKLTIAETEFLQAVAAGGRTLDVPPGSNADLRVIWFLDRLSYFKLLTVVRDDSGRAIAAPLTTLGNALLASASKLSKP